MRRARVAARASSTGEQADPNHPFLPEKAGGWNSGGSAPAWPEADPGAARKLDRITLVTSQTPEGDTAHEIWVSDEPIGNDTAKAKLVHTFKGETDTGQELTHPFAPGLTARYV